MKYPWAEYGLIIFLALLAVMVYATLYTWVILLAIHIGGW